MRCKNTVKPQVDKVKETHKQPTVSQLLNLDDGSFNALYKHMGHNPKVHREFYQMPQEMILKTQISKILVALDQGSLYKYNGKALNEFDPVRWNSQMATQNNLNYTVTEARANTDVSNSSDEDWVEENHSPKKPNRNKTGEQKPENYKKNPEKAKLE